MNAWNDVLSIHHLLDSAQTIAIVILAIYSFAMRRTLGNKKQIEEISLSNRNHLERIDRIETRLDQGPTHKDVGELHEKINDLNGTLREMVGEMGALRRSLDRVENKLISESRP